MPANDLTALVDTVLAIILIISLARGWTRGFLSLFLHGLSLLIAIWIARSFYTYAASWLTDLGLRARLTTVFARGLNSMVSGSTDQSSTLGLIQALPLPSFLKTGLISNNNSLAFAALGVSAFGDYVAVYLAMVAVNAISIVGLFLLSLLLLSLISRGLTFINRVPVIGFLNRLAGMALQLLLAVAVIWILFGLLSAAAPTSQSVSAFVQAIENSLIGGWLFRHNRMNSWLLVMSGL